MKKLLYIDACIRDEQSRTKRIATPVIEALKQKYEVQTLCINELDLSIVRKELVTKRTSGEIDTQVMQWAESVRDADRIVIAAPFWDMSFPAALKNFFELCSIMDVTFKTDDKTCYGNCKAEKLLYITTRGMNISTGDELEQATPYLKALSWLWGIGPMQVISVQNTDYLPASEVDNRIEEAIADGLKIAEDF